MEPKEAGGGRNYVQRCGGDQTDRKEENVWKVSCKCLNINEK